MNAESKACYQCESMTIHTVSPDHTLVWLILFIVTAGAAILINMLGAMTKPKPKCLTCGVDYNPYTLARIVKKRKHLRHLRS